MIIPTNSASRHTVGTCSVIPPNNVSTLGRTKGVRTMAVASIAIPNAVLPPTREIIRGAEISAWE